MSVALFGRIMVGIGAFGFGYLLFKGMVLEWHRRDGEARGQSH
jgi:hypothetical protein